MDRRNALKKLGILTGGLLMFPSCEFSEEKASLVLNKLEISATEASLMRDLVGCIIPEGELPGANTLQVQNIVWVMVDDCLDKDSRKSFISGLKIFEDRVKKISGNSFEDMSQEEREKTLTKIVGTNETEMNTEEKNLIAFIKITKYYTILGYMNSEYIMTEVMPYSLVPGTYGLCETIDNNKRININA